jgi:hypothetical protein
MSAAEAIEIAYSYQHTGLAPVALLTPMLHRVRKQQQQQQQQLQQQQPGLLEQLNAHQ